MCRFVTKLEGVITIRSFPWILMFVVRLAYSMPALDELSDVTNNTHVSLWQINGNGTESIFTDSILRNGSSSETRDILGEKLNVDNTSNWTTHLPSSLPSSFKDKAVVKAMGPPSPPPLWRPRPDDEVTSVRTPATYRRTGNNSYEAVVVPLCYYLRCSGTHPFMAFYQLWEARSQFSNLSFSLLTVDNYLIPLDCFCDTMCLVFGDCCYDYYSDTIRTVDVQQIQDFLSLFRSDDSLAPEIRLLMLYGECLVVETRYSTNFSLAMVAKCPKGFKSPSIRGLCENGQTATPFNVPVTHRFLRSLVFANIFCSRCHEIPDEEVEYWASIVNCVNVSFGENVTLSEVKKELNKNDSNCKTVIVGPATSNFRLCKHKVYSVDFSRLNTTGQIYSFSSAEIMFWCRQYYHPLAAMGKRYINPHCLLLEKTSQVDPSLQNIEHSWCFPLPSSANEPAPPPSLTLLFDFNNFESPLEYYDTPVQEQLLQTDNIQCDAGQVFDRYLQNCHALACSDGMDLVNRSCHVREDHLADPETQILTRGTTHFRLQFSCLGNPGDRTDSPKLVKLVRRCLRKAEQAIRDFAEDPDNIQARMTQESGVRLIFEAVASQQNSTFPQEKTSPETPFPSRARSAPTKDKEIDVASEDDMLYPTVEITLKSPFTISTVFQIAMLLTNAYRTCGDSGCLPAKVYFTNTENSKTLRCPFGKLHVVRDAQVVSLDERSVLVTLQNESRFYYNLSHVPFVLEMKDLVPRTVSMVMVCEAPSCVLIRYPAEDVPILMDALRKEDVEIQIEKEHLWERDDVIYVCVDHALGIRNVLSSRRRKSHWPEGDVEQLMSLYGLPLSVVCLAFTLAVYAALKPLRNEHGQKVMVMMATLLAAQIVFLASNVEDALACQVTAAFLHFLWLSVFSWMSLVSLDLARTFVANVPGGGSAACCSGGLARQGAVAFCLPLAFVAVFILLHCLPATHDVIGYGRILNGCWLTTQVGVLTGVLTPVGFSLLFNVACFVVALINIERKRMDTRNGRCSGGRRGMGGCWRAVVYVKLSLVMGGTWVLSYMAESLGLAWLRALAVVCNSLQGVLILVVFVVNRNVLSLVRRAAWRRRPKQRPRSHRPAHRATATTVSAAAVVVELQQR